MSTDNSAWAETQEWLQNVPNNAEVLKGDKKQGEILLRQLQISPRSLMGSIALETGGILFNHGWLRLLGSGNERMKRSLLDWNLAEDEFLLRDAFIVAHDAVGGFFAMNGGAFPGKKGNIFYMAPDTLEWRDIDGSYSQFFSWAATGNLEQFYKSMQWPGWEEEISSLNGDQGIAIYPFLWTKVDTPVLERSRRIVPMIELWKLQQDLARQIQNLPPGTPIKINFE